MSSCACQGGSQSHPKGNERRSNNTQGKPKRQDPFSNVPINRPIGHDAMICRSHAWDICHVSWELTKDIQRLNKKLPYNVSSNTQVYFVYHFGGMEAACRGRCYWLGPENNYLICVFRIMDVIYACILSCFTFVICIDPRTNLSK